MINSETFKELSQSCEIDSEEVNFDNAICSWVQGEISYKELITKYPSHLLNVPQRVLKKISEILK